MPESAKMIPLSEAFAIVDAAVGKIALPSETVPVRQAVGRTVAADQQSRVDLPPFDKSAMDGYAVMADDQRDTYRVLEFVAAGEIPTQPLTPGSAIKVMTGAPVPVGAGKVVMVEYTAEADGIVQVRSHSKADNICPKGEDVRIGDVVLAAGTVPGPLEIANLVSCGVTEVPVTRRLRASIISTGDEIVETPEQLTPGKIINTNAPMLGELCRKYGLEVAAEVTVPDDTAATVSALRTALEGSDIVIATGGVSVGDLDFVSGALGEVGLTPGFTRVAVKPGKPATFASAPGKAVFGLPGNPVSACVMFHLFVLRAAALMTGRRPPTRRVATTMGEAFARRKAERLELVACRLTPAGTPVPVVFHGPAHLHALAELDGFILVPPGVSELPAGAAVEFLPM